MLLLLARALSIKVLGADLVGLRTTPCVRRGSAKLVTLSLGVLRTLRRGKGATAAGIRGHRFAGGGKHVLLGLAGASGLHRVIQIVGRSKWI